MIALTDAQLNWALLSNIGQSYGAISAVLSGLALCGIAISVTMQWRQSQLSQEAAARDRHLELVKIVLENPELGGKRRERYRDDAQFRVAMMNNLWVTSWETLWRIGDLGDQSLRSACREMFSEQDARDWWNNVGGSCRSRQGWPQVRNHRRRMLFVGSCRI